MTGEEILPFLSSRGAKRRGDLAFLSLKKLKSKLDRVKNLGLPRKRNHELAMTPCPVTPECLYQGSTSI